VAAAAFRLSQASPRRGGTAVIGLLDDWFGLRFAGVNCPAGARPRRRRRPTQPPWRREHGRRWRWLRRTAPQPRRPRRVGVQPAGSYPGLRVCRSSSRTVGQSSPASSSVAWYAASEGEALNATTAASSAMSRSPMLLAQARSHSASFCLSGAVQGQPVLGDLQGCPWPVVFPEYFGQCECIVWRVEVVLAVLDCLVDTSLRHEHGDVRVDQVGGFGQIQVFFDAVLPFEDVEADSDEVLGVPRWVPSQRSTPLRSLASPAGSVRNPSPAEPPRGRRCAVDDACSPHSCSHRQRRSSQSARSPPREIGRQQRFGQRRVDLVEKLEDGLGIVVREREPLLVHQLICEWFGDIECRLAVVGFDGGPRLIEQVPSSSTSVFNGCIRIVGVQSTPGRRLEDRLDVASNRLLVDVRALVTGAIGGSVRVGWFESRFDPCREVRMMLNEIDEEVRSSAGSASATSSETGGRWLMESGARLYVRRTATRCLQIPP